MKQTLYITAIAAAALSSCADNIAVKSVQNDNSLLTVIDESKVTAEGKLKMSDIAEDFRIIQFEDLDEALLKYGSPVFSDNYIAMKDDGEPVKLFRMDGSYVGKLGDIGSGPGEYTSLSNMLIDESGNRVYILAFNGRIHCYDLQCNHIRDINIGQNIKKGKLYMNPDSTLSITHLCFLDRDRNPFTSARIHKDFTEGDSIEYTLSPSVAIKNSDQGFDHEIWSYRNNPSCFSFNITTNDTLFHYDAASNKMYADLILSMTPGRRGDAWWIYYDLPYKWIISIQGGNNPGLIVVDKNDGTAYRATRVNDFFFDLPAGFNFRDGYAYTCQEPMAWKEYLDDKIADGEVPDDKVEAARAYAESIIDGNNIMILAKLRKQP